MHWISTDEVDSYVVQTTNRSWVWYIQAKDKNQIMLRNAVAVPTSFGKRKNGRPMPKSGQNDITPTSPFTCLIKSFHTRHHIAPFATAAFFKLCQ